MDLLTILTILGAATGQILHIVKKRTEEGKSEVAAFRKWVLQRPFNTAGAILLNITAALQLQPEGFLAFGGDVSPDQLAVKAFLAAFTVGFAADSLVNRPGK
ncbi:hypothetical protein LCGC14_2716700 [marine sediment metagenome]|uniref:Uncharacterized protein n=1 Tax=marine sediment metagenome TaxID=412755 RepID=A0A0F9BKD1_9ZZZZ